MNITSLNKQKFKKRSLHLTNPFIKEIQKNWIMFLMLVPSIVIVIFISYLPMSGLVLAFKNYRFDKGVFGSDWTGLSNFKYFFTSGTAWNITLNTITYNLRNLIFTQVMAILVALFLDEVHHKVFKKLSQSAIFFPYFISWTIVGVFAFSVLNYETGSLNSLLTTLGYEKINVYSMPEIWKWIVMIVALWKNIGFASVIYIAAIANVDRESYEAAEVDGANIFRRVWHITLPGIKPAIIMVLLLSIGNILRGNFEMFYQLIGNNGQLFKATDVIDTYVFRTLTGPTMNLGTMSAATFYQSVVCFIIIILVNGIVKKYDSDSAMF